MMEERGEIESDEARRWKEGIYGLMVLWQLGPDELVSPCGPGDWIEAQVERL